MSALLQVEGLEVTYAGSGGTVHAVRGVDLTVAPGEVVAVVGESGSGKTTLAAALLGLLPAAGAVAAGTVSLDGTTLTGLSERAYRSVRAARIGLVPQDPGVALNPVQKVGVQVAEVLRTHGLADRRSAPARAVELLGQAGLDEPGTRAGQYPHQLSGGMRQRVLIAIAIAAGPALVVADEPTSALDATVARRILDHLDTLRRDLGTALLLITHDLAVATDRADRIVVMRHGRVVEQGTPAELLAGAQDPYTRELLAAAPGLALTAPPVLPPVDTAGTPVAEVRDLVKEFPLPRARGSWTRRTHRAVDGVSFTIARGETVALVGESGSGKSTTARLLLRLEDPTSGQVLLGGHDVTRVRGEAWRALRRRAQLIYQNPYASLDPRFTVREIVTEPLRAFSVGSAAEQADRAAELVDRVALPSGTLDRRPGELSGGQRQRVAIARALALSPDLVVADEPVSALDVSVQAQVLELLAELQERDGLSYLFISHDLAVVRRVAHRTGVMRDGRLRELRPTAELFDDPRDEYTRELLAAIAGRRAGVVQ
ncbi:dipeptide ABC transporter ATP-binding protein [Pseudonocardia sp. UM4_GMWB1]|uniref:dipeptide ABC transporter ATP-binding protein n=1 Tax=unclassified Pseudonocardia TaxID=2619320 RepID=UPI00091C126F|nr:ABC transporter ATP-binding protein [Pseudonocardia sp. SID8383]MYW72093.1 dipeptide ABC transporter ATP-binding protein [Pseudonocardia sp. SID8383]OJG08254.1 Glutathione import ATP-binding protein GsiA [Pseudonocardia autotrophica]